MEQNIRLPHRCLYVFGFHIRKDNYFVYLCIRNRFPMGKIPKRHIDGWLALSPLIVFLCVYLVSSIAMLLHPCVHIRHGCFLVIEGTQVHDLDAQPLLHFQKLR